MPEYRDVAAVLAEFVSSPTALLGATDAMMKLFESQQKETYPTLHSVPDPPF